MIPALAIVFGLIMGSFLSMLIPRLHNEEKGIIAGRSHCPNCKKTLSALELIPVLSFILQAGKCRKCKKQISWWYPLIELSTALTFFWMSITFQSALDVALWSILMWVLLYIFFYDLRYKEVHDIIMFPALILAFAFSFVLGDPLDSIIGTAVGLSFFGIQFLASKGRWLGSGDLLIGTYMGLLLGWQNTLVALFLSYILGSSVGIYLLASKKADRNTALPLGPFLVVGSMIAFVYGELLIKLFLGL